MTTLPTLMLLVLPHTVLTSSEPTSAPWWQPTRTLELRVSTAEDLERETRVLPTLAVDPHALHGGVDGVVFADHGVMRERVAAARLTVVFARDGMVENVEVREAWGHPSAIDALVEEAHAQLPRRESVVSRETWLGEVHVERTHPSLAGCFIDVQEGIECGALARRSLRRLE